MQPFRFFDLPRELRNAVYGHTIQPRRHISAARIAEYTMTYVLDAPDTNMLLASRQINHEYREEVADRTRLLVIGPYFHHTWSPSFWKEPIVASTRHCIACFHVGCWCDVFQEFKENLNEYCEGVDMLRKYASSIEVGMVKRMPKLQTIELRLGVHHAEKRKAIDTTHEGSQQLPSISHLTLCQDALEELTILPHMDSIVIAHCADETEYKQFCEARVYPAMAIWTPNDGWRSQTK